MTLVSVPELAAYMSGVRMKQPQIESAGDIIAGVQSALERHINRSVEPRAVREGVMTDGRGYAVFSQSPARSIRSMRMYSGFTADQETILGPLAPLDPMPVYSGGPSYDHAPDNNGISLIVPGGAMLGIPNAYFVVDYIAGGGDWMEPHIPDLKMAILRVAAREWSIMHDDSVAIQGGTIGDPVDAIPVTSKGWTQEELASFDRLRRRVII